ncbi:MAG: fibronectin type III domain-containing protein [Planctomycetes bacterium]|nr:fibronectin type III domain-containing protein [Planctomycetota bacterium]
MRLRPPLLSAALSTCAVALLGVSAVVIGQQAPLSRPTSDAVSRLPLTFIENRGQWAAAGRFLARDGAMTVGLEDRAVAIRIEEPDGPRAAVVRLVFEGSHERPRVVAEQCRPGVWNFLRGTDRTNHHTGVPGFAAVRYRDLYQGVELRFRESKRGGLEYDLLLAPGATLDRFVVRVDGAEGLSVDSDGSLRIQTDLGPLVQSAPCTWEETADGMRRPLECRARLLDHHRFGFEVTGRDPTCTLIIDPVLSFATGFSTYLGGPGWEIVNGVAIDDTGVVTAMFTTDWPLLPTTSGCFESSFNGSRDLALVKFDEHGTLIYATYLAIDAAVNCHHDPLELDADGDAWIAGMTEGEFVSPWVINGVQPIPGGGLDGILLELKADGVTPGYATYLGGSGGDRCDGIALGKPDPVDGHQDVFVTGMTWSIDYPTTAGAYDETFNVGDLSYYPDGFVARIDPVANAFVYSTFLGASQYDYPKGIAVDAEGCAHVFGFTQPVYPGLDNFPTTGSALVPSFSFRKKDPAVGSLFVCRLDATGSSLPYSTLVTKDLRDASPSGGIAVDELGRTCFVSTTRSAELPVTANALSGSLQGYEDAFVWLLDTRQSGIASLAYGTYLGGAGTEGAVGVAVGDDGSILVCGTTAPTGNLQQPLFPTTEPTLPAGHVDAFVSIFVRDAPTDSWVLGYSNLFGGEYFDEARGIALSPSGAIAVSGSTSSYGFPVTQGAFDSQLDGTQDGFVFTLHPASSPTIPAAPTALSATAETAYRIRLDWTDNASDEDGFRIERAQGGGAWQLLDGDVAVDTVEYLDDTVLPDTAYAYRVLAWNAAGDSAWSSDAGATTPPDSGGGDVVANGEIAVAGTVAGTYVDTQADDGLWESLTEQESGGKPSTRYSYLEHVWTFSVTAGTKAIEINAWLAAQSADGDSFEFWWRMDGSTYLPLVTVDGNQTNPDNVQSASFTVPVGGTLHIRVIDTDRDRGNRTLDTLHVDYLAIRDAP